MNVDLETLEKELKYISLKLNNCFNIYEYNDLMYTYTFLDVLYFHLTSKHYPQPSSKYINERWSIIKFNRIIKKSELDFIRRFEREKNTYAQPMLNYVNKFVGCPEEIVYPIVTPTSFSIEESKELILDFFSEYGEEVYNIVKSIFDNKQIQTGIKNTDHVSNTEIRFKSIISQLGEINSEEYTEESIKELLDYFSSIEKLFYNDNVSPEQYEEIGDKLLELYEKLIPIKKEFKKPNISFDDIGETSAFTYFSSSLKKTYILITSKEVNVYELSELVHELGHAIESYLVSYSKDHASYEDTLFLSEVSSSFFEFDFLNYLRRKNICVEEVDSTLYDFYLDIADDFIILLDTLDAKPDYKSYDETCTYSDKSGTTFNVDIRNRVKYGLNKYIAILFSKKRMENSNGFLEKFLEFLENSEKKSTSELLRNFGIAEEEFENINIDDVTLQRLIRKYK